MLLHSGRLIPTVSLCLQDIHWSAGAFGYFPTYSLGAMYACQIFKEAERRLPALHDQIAAGNFGDLKAGC